MHKKHLIPHCQCHCLPRPLLEPICELSLLVVLPSLVERQSGGRIVRARKTTKSSGNFKASSHFISFSCLRKQGIQHFKTSVGIQVPCKFLLLKLGFQMPWGLESTKVNHPIGGGPCYTSITIYHHLGAYHLSTKRHLQVESGRQSSCHFRLDLLRCQAYMTNGFNHCSLGIRHPARNKKTTLMFRRLWT